MRGAIDRITGWLRGHLHGSRIQSWRITDVAYGVLMRFVQGADGGRDIETSFRGATFVTSATDYTVTPTMRDGSYEQAELDAWLHLLADGQTVLDVGANVGVFSVLSARRVGSRGHVIAFEPEVTNLERLRVNLTRNECHNVTVVGKCVGRTEGTAILNLDPGQSGTHSVAREKGAASIEVPMCTIDTYVGNQHIDAIKIDVEGLEVDVMAGARNTIERDRPTLLVEFNGDPALANLIADLLAYAYDQCWFFTRRDGRVKVDGAAIGDLAASRTYGNLLLVRPREA